MLLARLLWWWLMALLKDPDLLASRSGVGYIYGTGQVQHSPIESPTSLFPSTPSFSIIFPETPSFSYVGTV